MQISINITGDISTGSEVEAFLARLRQLFSANTTAANPVERKAAAEVVADKVPEGSRVAVSDAPATETGNSDAEVAPATNVTGEPSGTAKRKRRTKEEMARDALEAESLAASFDSAPSAQTVKVQPTPAAASNVTADDVRGAVNALLMTDGGEPRLIETLSAYGAKGVKDLKPEYYAAVVAKLKGVEQTPAKQNFGNYM